MWCLNLFWFVIIFSINASVTSSTEAVKSKTVILLKKGKVYLSLNQFKKEVCLHIVLLTLFYVPCFH